MFKAVFFLLLAPCAARDGGRWGGGSEVHVFSSVNGAEVASCKGEVMASAVKAPLACVPEGTVSVHLALGPFKHTASLDSPAMWGHAEWMQHDTGAEWVHARLWRKKRDHVLIFI